MLSGHQDSIATALEKQRTLSEVCCHVPCHVTQPRTCNCHCPATASVTDGRDGGLAAEDSEAPAGTSWCQHGTGEHHHTIHHVA